MDGKGALWRRGHSGEEGTLAKRALWRRGYSGEEGTLAKRVLWRWGPHAGRTLVEHLDAMTAHRHDQSQNT